MVAPKEMEMGNELYFPLSRDFLKQPLCNTTQILGFTVMIMLDYFDYIKG